MGLRIGDRDCFGAELFRWSRPEWENSSKMLRNPKKIIGKTRKRESSPPWRAELRTTWRNELLACWFRLGGVVIDITCENSCRPQVHVWNLISSMSKNKVWKVNNTMKNRRKRETGHWNLTDTR